MNASRVAPSAAAGYGAYSFWLESCGDDLTPRPGLDGSTDVDVAILGGGYTGLWTAYYLLKSQPALRVAIVERKIAGFGASGRNGGWGSSKLNIGLDAVAGRYGREKARALPRALFDTADEIGRVRGALGAWFCPQYGRVHPGKLARGLARLVERLGGRIYEGTEVTGIASGARPCLRTARGLVRARAIVLAGEAYLTRLPGLHRSLLPVYSLIVLTEPLGGERWAEIGWQGRECLASFRISIDYLSRTDDGRILFGGRGAPYRFRAAIADAHDRDPPTHEMLRRMARHRFPRLQAAP